MDGVLLGEREAGERSVTGRGHCSAVEDGVLLGKREAGERSVTGRGPRIRLLSIATTKSGGEARCHLGLWTSEDIERNASAEHRLCAMHKHELNGG